MEPLFGTTFRNHFCISTAPQQHLDCVSTASRFHLASISTASQLHLSCISISSRLYLAGISLAYQQHLDRISTASCQPLNSISTASRLPQKFDCLSIASRQHLGCIPNSLSAASQQHLNSISTASRLQLQCFISKDGVAGCSRVWFQPLCLSQHTRLRRTRSSMFRVPCSQFHNFETLAPELLQTD